MHPDNPNTTPEADAERADFGRRLLAAFDAIADLPPTEREPALLRLREDSPRLEQEVRALLARDAETGPLDATLSGQIQPLLREALPELDPAPAQIGPYQVLRLLGEGGMGRVYLARRSEGPVAREVAIKLIRPDRAGAGLIARFEAERRHLAALDHPGICRFIDADSLADGTPYVVMEVVQGEPIIDYCQRNALGLRARVELLRKLLAAVAHAHDRLLLHRDIKPHNVLVTADGQPKLLDFGIAKSIEDAQASVTRTAERFFTPNASAPEQLLGEPAGVACDVYSLGALAFELLSGTLPFDFDGLRAAEIERLILQVAPPLMSERSVQPWARELRGDLDAIVATCLRKSPGERYRNVDALNAELQRWQEGRPVTARAPSWTYRSRLFIRRHRTAFGLSAALILAITAFGSGLVLQAIELREQRNLAVVERDRALQVVEILESAFRNADPSGGSGDTVTARQILDSATPGINALESTNPELFVRLAATLARVELDVANSKNAGSWVERGIKVSEEIEALPSIAVHSLLSSGALAAAREGNTLRARSFLAQLEQLNQSSTADYMFSYARVLSEESKYQEAEEIARRAIEQLDANGMGPESTIANELRWLIAGALSSRKMPYAAAEYIENTIHWQLQRLAPHHPRVLRSRILKFIYLGQSNLNETQISELAATIKDLEEQLGSDNAVLGRIRTTYASILSLSSRHREAIEQYQIAFPVISAARGSDHIETLRIAINYANALAREGSEENLTKALEAFRSIYATCAEKFRPEATITHRAQSGLLYTLIRSAAWDSLDYVLSSPQYQTETHRNNHRITEQQLELLTMISDHPTCASDGAGRHCRSAESAKKRLTARPLNFD